MPMSVRVVAGGWRGDDAGIRGGEPDEPEPRLRQHSASLRPAPSL